MKALTTAIGSCLALAACSVSVDHDQYNSRADVQIRTPVGHVFVKPAAVVAPPAAKAPAAAATTEK